MTNKKPKLDSATLRILKRMLAMPPKPHEEMKVGKKNEKSATKKKGS